jgi:hypothetical protein
MLEGTAAVSWGKDRIDLFWVSADDALTHRSFREGAWDDPESLGGTLVSAPDLSRRCPLEPLLGRVVVARLGVARRRADRHAVRLILGRGPHRRLGARPRSDRLAPLVGRFAMGGLGAPPPLSVAVIESTRREGMVPP